MDISRLNIRDFLEKAVLEVPDAPFLIWQRESVSYSELNRQADLAADMWARLGVVKGDRVAIMATNQPDFVYTWLGLVKIGGILVAINTAFKDAETKYILEQSACKFALIDLDYADMFARISPELPHLSEVLVFGSDDRFVPYDELIANSEPKAPLVRLDGNDVASFIYTSGTTGKPKAVMQTHKNFVLTGQAYPSWMGMAKGDRIYACLPLFHINSQAYSVMGAIGARGAVVLARRFSASGFWDDIRQNKVSVFNFIGAMTLILSKRVPSDADRDHSVKVAYGVPALPGALRDELESRYGMSIISGFGMSETTFGLLEPLGTPRKNGSMGFPRHHPNHEVPRTEAKIVDSSGNALGAGNIGELVLRSPALMAGYFNEEDRTREALRDGWLFTGDMAWRDEDGYYFFVDRKKDIVRRRGENVSSLEVERVIDEHPGVLESAVIGVPSEFTDEDVFAFIVPKNDTSLDLAQLHSWLGERLADFKVPRFLQMIDALPKTGTQKIEKHNLRNIAAEPVTDRFDLAATAPR